MIGRSIERPYSMDSALSYIAKRLKRLTLLVYLSQGLVKILTVLGFGIGVFVLLDYSFFLTSGIRALFLILLCCVAIGISAIHRFNPLRELEKSFPEFKGRLFASLSSYRPDTGYSTELLNEIRARTCELLESIDLRKVIGNRLRPLLKLLSIASVCAVVGIILVPSPRFVRVKRLILPGQKFFSLTLSPGDVKVAYGDSVQIEAKPHTLMPRKIAIVANSKRIPAHKDQKFRTLVEATEDITYYAVLGDVSSDTHQITVMVRPWIKDIELTYTYPEYTGIASFSSAFPSIEALYGTRVNITGEANTFLDSATIGFANGEDLIMSVDGIRFQTEFRVTRSDTYRISFVASNGLGSVTPERWPIRALEDRSPEVELLFPGVDVEIPVSMQIPITFRAADDYGISRTELVSDRGSWRMTADAGTDTIIIYEWDISQVSLMPGEVMKYWVEVHDNDALKGPKSAKTREYRLYFPRIEEIYERITQDETHSITELERVLGDLQKSASQLEKMTSQSGAPLNPRDREEVESMLAKMKDIKARADEVAAKLNELQKAAERSWQVDRDLAEKLRELQRLFDEFSFPEMDEAIRKVDEALKKNPELLAQALENLKSSQEELKQRVERTIELLKKFRNEQLLKAAADKAKELEEWQRDVVSRTEQADSVSDLAKEEDALSEEAGKLSEDLEKLSKEMPGLGDKLTEEAERASDTETQLSKASDQLSAGKKALKLQRKALKQLSNLASNLDSMYQSVTSQAKEEISREIRKLESELLFLSFEEENIKGESLDMAFRQEAMIKGVKIARNQLRSLTNMTPFISQATDGHLLDCLGSMEKAKQSFERRNVEGGEGDRKAAMTSLNEAVVELMESDDALQQSCSASGIPQLMQRLSQLAQSQQSLNQLVQSMLPLNLMQSQSGGNQLQQLSAQQQALADELQEIAQGLRGKVLGDLGGTADEMEKIAQDMKKAIPRDIVERQRKVLKHLLDSQRSIYAKKHSRRRISEPGKDFRRLPSPIELELMTRRGLSQKEILESLQKSYPAEYEILIRAYFRALSTE